MVEITSYLTVEYLLSVIHMGGTRVVVIGGMEDVVTSQELVLVLAVQTPHVYTETGKNQMVHRSGDMTGGVVLTIPYLTVHLLSVIHMGGTRVVVIGGMEGVVTQQNFVLVLAV